MGQFLAIGLVTQISVDKKKLARVQLTPEQLQERMKAQLHYDPALYLLRDYDDFYGFDLNEDIFYALKWTPAGGQKVAEFKLVT